MEQKECVPSMSEIPQMLYNRVISQPITSPGNELSLHISTRPRLSDHPRCVTDNDVRRTGTVNVTVTPSTLISSTVRLVLSRTLMTG